MSTAESVSAAELTRLPLFEGLSPADLEGLAGLSVRRVLADGETLVEMGAPISEIHWLEKGQLALRVRHEHRWILVSTLHAGDLLGWSALREEPKALSTARAIGPAGLHAHIRAVGPAERRIRSVGVASEAAVRDRHSSPRREPSAASPAGPRRGHLGGLTIRRP